MAKAYTDASRSAPAVAPHESAVIRIVHLSTYASHGGAARAALRLHRTLLEAGCTSTMLVRKKNGDEPQVESIGTDARWSAKLKRRVRKLSMRPEVSHIRRQMVDWVEYFAHDRSDLGGELLDALPPADVVTLHWVVGMLDVERHLPALAERTPLVWRLDDASPLTGGCVYPWDCTRFRQQCGACPQLASIREHDASRTIFDRKSRAYDRLDRKRLHFVAMTQWMAGLVRNSRCGERFDVTVIPNSIDHRIFTPRDRGAARAAIGLPADAPVILFIAHDLTVPRKGLKQLLAAIARMPRSSRPVLMTIGDRAPEVTTTAHKHLGMIHDDIELSQAYSAADALVLPSLQDNLPNTALEAMACGTPVVGFDVGGIPDIVRSHDTGLLAPVGDETALSETIASLLGDRGLRDRMSQNCRRAALRDYDPRTQASRFLELYRSMLVGSA